MDETEADEQASTGSSTQDIEVNALFTVDLDPPSRTIEPDDIAFFSYAIEPLSGFTGNVFLDVASDPVFDGDLFLFDTVVTPPVSDTLIVFSSCETAPGTYNLTMTGTGDDGSTASATTVLTVAESTAPPRADFFASRDGFRVQFSDSSFTDSFCDRIVAWAWDFGDGTTSTLENPVHTYATRGDYPVTLTVTDDNGRTDSVTEQVLVLPPPPVLDIVGVTRIRERFEFRVDLEWSGAEGELIELYRNFDMVDLPDNDGEHRDRFRSLQTSFTWRICELRVAQCSNEVRLTVAPNPSGEATVTTVIDGQTVVSKIRIQDE